MPAGFDHEISALLADTLTTGFGAVCREAALRIGESCVVTGVGGIGLGAVLGASLAGAFPIIAVDIHEHKLEMARRFGATHCVHSTKANLSDALADLLPGGKADALFEATGNPLVIEAAWKQLGPKGRAILIGVMRHEQHLALNTLPLHYGKRLIGTEGGGSLPHLDIPRYVAMIQAGRFDPKPMITHRHPLSSINEAIELMKAGLSIHSIIHFNS